MFCERTLASQIACLLGVFSMTFAFYIAAIAYCADLQEAVSNLWLFLTQGASISLATSCVATLVYHAIVVYRVGPPSD